MDGADRVQALSCAESDLLSTARVPALERLVGAVETCWPAMAAYLRLRVTNAYTEAYNCKIKRIKRVSCGSATSSPTSGASCSRRPRRQRDGRSAGVDHHAPTGKSP